MSGAIRASGLGKRFEQRGRAPLVVLQDCSLELRAGELTVLMGPSGCGKSTLGHMLAGYVDADSGSAAIDGAPIRCPGPDRLLMFQETALWPWMSVVENVMFGPLSRGSLDRRAARAQAQALLDKFGLSGFGERFPGQLSGGMKRRVELAQALINSPKLMILDEPFRGLDVMTRELMQEHYLTLFEETRLTTLFISAELEEAIFLADRILFMSAAPGRIIDSIEVDLPRPRRFEALASARYAELKTQAMRILERIDTVDTIDTANSTNQPGRNE